MLRARLFKLADTEHALMLLMHHIAADSWSMPILYRELGPGYAAFANGAVPKLTELPAQYADFAPMAGKHFQREVR